MSAGVISRRWLRAFLLIAVPCAAVALALLYWLWGGRYITTENAYVKADIAQISSEVAGRVLEVHIQDHANVKAGEVLVTLDSEPFRVALAKADAELDSSRGQVRTLIATWYEAKSELIEAREQGLLLERAGCAPEGARRPGHRRLEQARGIPEQRHGGR